VQTGELQAASPAAVARELAQRGWAAIDIRPKATGKPAVASSGNANTTATTSATTPAATPRLKRRFGQGHSKETIECLGLALRELSALLKAGVPLMRALQLAADSTPDEAVRLALQRITRDLDNGHNLVSAAEHERVASGLLTAYDVAMLQVGEQTGRLPEAFAELHRHREFVRSTSEQVGAALRYPAFVILTCLLAMVVVNLWVIPAFAKVFAHARAELPLLTQMLLGMSRAMLKYWPLGLAGLGGSAWGWLYWLKQPQGRLWWDERKLRLPIVGRILEGVVLARLARSLSSGLSAGLTITDALAVTARTLGNTFYETRLGQMGAELARGSSITAAARNMGMLPPTMVQLFAIGEESGSLDELMAEMSNHHQSEVEQSIRKLSSTLEPILIWFLGICVLVLALGIFMPMWDLGRATLK